MLRTAAAAGVDGVLLSPAVSIRPIPKWCAAEWARSYVYRCKWRIGRKSRDFWRRCRCGRRQLMERRSIRPSTGRQISALIIGSEAHGAGPEARALAQGEVAIPMAAATESLNAAIAAAIILFEAARQRRHRE
jgi:TrmH family RNA methyltransferase